MDVRRYEGRADARGIARVNALAWRDAYEGLVPAAVLDRLDPDPDEEAVDGWHEGLAANRRGVFVAVERRDGSDDETVRGYADVRWGDAGTKAFVGEGEADLKAVYVDPDWWGEGVGTALLERVLDALPDSVDTLRLEMLEGNEVGRRFYEARGFERTGTASHDIGGESHPTVVYSRAV
ncbi:GNAT family N-acetyltransferase [Candidatus Halobonum tyrrellensis]|uniref:Acetyltransferase n=1 Tax=Candidatus Halobonum tyrrellensis G22 TaxID=1324957 RepID=V4GRT1_9EURY|nr:GNAT family N-acetyltransferase [Candidatus Halobonum tyrrellensis]ESP87761.1 acetyltransferase [Candidatus Halobonum tyrrellensis G22]